MTEIFKPGATAQVHGLVLDVSAHQEKDLILSVLTAEFGKISCFARSARNSKRRFPPALMQPLQHILIHVKIPRGFFQGRSELWMLDHVDLKGDFLHLKKSYVSLEWVSLVLRLIKDTFPQEHQDVSVFRSLGRILRDSSFIDENKLKTAWNWLFMSYWIWFSKHMGWGHSFCDISLANDNAQMMFMNFSLEDELSVLKIVQLINEAELPEILLRDWSRIYKNWSYENSQNWPYFEKWMVSRAEYSKNL